MSSHTVNIINNTDEDIPSQNKIESWVNAVLQEQEKDYSINITIEKNKSMQALNNTYRKKNKPTNVLAFPYSPPPVELDGPAHLGDLAICPAVLQDEAILQNKKILDHWAHIIIHGILHLIGYDHIEENDANIMEEKEKVLLKKLDINNPYEEKK